MHYKSFETSMSKNFILLYYYWNKCPKYFQCHFGNYFISSFA